jgi:hypothetical protein
MTKQESDELITEAQQFLGRPFHEVGNEGSISDFVGTKHHVTGDDYQPLAVFHSRTTGFWNRDLAPVLDLYRGSVKG